MTLTLFDETETGAESVSPNPNTAPTNGGVEISTENIESKLADIENLVGEPVKRKRGRPRKTASIETPAGESAPAGFDAAQIADTLVGVYFQTCSLLARTVITPTPEKAELVKPLIVHCANKYMPQGASEHMPLAILALVTIDIVREARQKKTEGEKDNV